MKLLSFKLFFPNFQTGRIYFFGFFEFLFFFFKWPRDCEWSQISSVWQTGKHQKKCLKCVVKCLLCDVNCFEKKMR